MTLDATAAYDARPVVDAEHPWLGLHFYTEETQSYFFGRDAEIREIFTRVRDQALTVLYGQSGLGKSSLLRAGLLPKLRVEQYRPVVLRLDFSESAPSLTEQTHSALREAVPNLSSSSASESTLWGLLHRRPSQPAHKLEAAEGREPGLEESPPVLIFNQFEEIFTLGSARRVEVEAWFSQIADLVENSPPVELQERFKKERALLRAYSHSPSPARVTLSLREDYLSHLESWKRVLPSLMRNRMALHLLSGPQALEVAVRAGGRGKHAIVSEEVGAQIVRQIAGKPPDVPLDSIEAVPPFLSLLCEQLNLERLRLGQAEITANLVSARGENILDQYYEDSFAGQPEAVRRQVEDRLVSTGGHRNPVFREDLLCDLQALAVKEPELHLNTLVARRLLTMEERGGQVRVELTHDVLTPLVARSRAARREREAVLDAKRQRARRLLWVTGLGALVVVFAGLAVFGWSSYQSAKEERLRADEARDSARLNARRAEDNAVEAKKQEAEAKRQEAEAKRLKQKVEVELKDLREKVEEAVKKGNVAALRRLGAQLGIETVRRNAAECPGCGNKLETRIPWDENP